MLACLGGVAQADPLFSNSVVSNDIEFLQANDLSAFSCVRQIEQRRAEMPDKRNNGLFVDNVAVFRAAYTDGSSTEIWVHPGVGAQAGTQLARDVAERVGLLPTLMRKKLDHVVIHQGDETAFSEDQGRFFVLYSENIRTRLRNHDLEETIFHESVHATLDVPMANSSAWKRAQRRDGDFVTEYGADIPRSEDLAESALFAWAYFFHADRLPAEVRDGLGDIMPNRLAFFHEVFVASGPNFQQIGPDTGC